MAARRTRRAPTKKRKQAPPPAIVTGATLEPIRMVERVLTRPDGQTFRVTVPVYPPFRLAERPAKADSRRRQAEEKKAS